MSTTEAPQKRPRSASFIDPVTVKKRPRRPSLKLETEEDNSGNGDNVAGGPRRRNDVERAMDDDSVFRQMILKANQWKFEIGAKIMSIKRKTKKRKNQKPEPTSEQAVEPVEPGDETPATDIYSDFRLRF